MATVTLTSPAQIPGVVANILGFVPEESIVVVPVGGGPTVRLDLGPVNQMRDALTAALPHWAWRPVLVAVYTESPAAAALVADNIDLVLPGVDVRDLVHVDGATITDPLDPSTRPLTATGAPAGLPARDVAASRADLVAAADLITDAGVAERVAWISYENGDGARAWAYYDRAAALAGAVSDTLADLGHRLTNAVPPNRWLTTQPA